MVETAAHLTDHVFSHLPLREWVLSMPKRLRYLMQRDGAALNLVLRILLPVIARSLSANCPDAEHLGKAARHIGAVYLVHRVGLNMNGDLNFHVRAVDGVFEEVAGANWTFLDREFVGVG